jgi:hypothetical protein
MSFCLTLVAGSFARGQILNVTNDTATPVPGSAHHYIKMLSETVNPANGSVSLRIGVPVPPGRRLTIPFAFTYDSNGVHHLIGDGHGGSSWWSNTTFLSRGGWGYSVPLMSLNQVNWTRPVNSFPVTCIFYNDFVFADSSGTRHSFYLSAPASNSVSQCSQIPNPPDFSYSTMGSLFQATTPSPGGSDFGGPYPSITLADADGTVFHISHNNFHSGSIVASLPDYIEDRNGNKVTLTDSGGGAFSLADTAGRTAFSSSGFGATGNTVSVSGLSGAYSMTWGTANTNFGAPSPIQVGSGSFCATIPGDAETQPVLTAITLPNGKQYTFTYDGTYGLLNKVTYPTGGYVSYTWGVNPRAEFAAYVDQNGNAQVCQYDYDSFAVTHRYVSFDGTNIALQQDFSYSTTWNGTSTAWTSKQTTVTTRDLLRGGSFATTYSYTPFDVGLPPNEVSYFANNIPLEKSVTYQDWGGATLRTVTQAWFDQSS